MAISDGPGPDIRPIGTSDDIIMAVNHNHAARKSLSRRKTKLAIFIALTIIFWVSFTYVTVTKGWNIASTILVFIALVISCLSSVEWDSFNRERAVKRLSQVIMTSPLRQFQSNLGHWLESYQSWRDEASQKQLHHYKLQVNTAALRQALIEALEFLDSLGTVQERIVKVDNIEFDAKRARECKEKIDEALLKLNFMT